MSKGRPEKETVTQDDSDGETPLSAATHTMLRETVTVSEVGDFDILLGRGKRSYNHIGNIRFREMILDRALAYMANESKPFRKAMAQGIIAEVGNKGGRFLRPADSSRANDGVLAGRWEVVSKSIARTKVKQALRDMGTTGLQKARGGGKSMSSQAIHPHISTMQTSSSTTFPSLESHNLLHSFGQTTQAPSMASLPGDQSQIFHNFGASPFSGLGQLSSASLPPLERLQGFPPLERLQGLPQTSASFPSLERLQGLSQLERLQGLPHGVHSTLPHANLPSASQQQGVRDARDLQALSQLNSADLQTLMFQQWQQQQQQQQQEQQQQQRAALELATLLGQEEQRRILSNQFSPPTGLPGHSLYGGGIGPFGSSLLGGFPSSHMGAVSNDLRNLLPNTSYSGLSDSVALRNIALREAIESQHQLLATETERGGNMGDRTVFPTPGYHLPSNAQESLTNPLPDNATVFSNDSAFKSEEADGKKSAETSSDDTGSSSSAL